MGKKQEKAKIENEELDETEEIEEIEENEELEEPEAPKKSAKKVDIMDSADSNEPPKKKHVKQKFENKLDLSPVIEAINGLSSKLEEKPKKSKKDPEPENRGFMDVLGDW